MVSGFHGPLAPLLPTPRPPGEGGQYIVFEEIHFLISDLRKFSVKFIFDSKGWQLVLGLFNICLDQSICFPSWPLSGFCIAKMSFLQHLAQLWKSTSILITFTCFQIWVTYHSFCVELPFVSNRWILIRKAIRRQILSWGNERNTAISHLPWISHLLVLSHSMWVGVKL